MPRHVDPPECSTVQRNAKGSTTPKHTELTEAHKGDQCTTLVGRPRRLGFDPANGWAAQFKHFGGYPGSAPTGRVALPG